MDARTCHFHRTVGYGANGCRKIWMSSRMMMMMRMRMMTMMLMMRHCEGAAAWRDAQGMWREFTWGGGMELDIHSHSWTKISGFEKRAPHDCHGWSSLSLFKEPFGGILSDTRIVRGNKTRSVLAQTPMSLFAVPMDARTCHFHRTVGYLENACRKIRMSSRMMMVMRRRMMMMMLMMMVMMTRHCEGPAAWRDSPGIWREFPLRGREGGALIVVVMWLQLGWFMNRGRAWNWTFIAIAERRYLDSKRGHLTIAMVDHHLVYLKSHLEVYCLTHASCGERKHGQC